MNKETTNNTITVDEYKTAIKVMESYDQTEVVDYLRFDLDALEEKLTAEWEINKWTVFTLEDCPNKRVFLSWAEDTLDEDLRENTPHGECGGDINGYFKWGGKKWLVTYAPDWNRYDKQFYYIDNYGGGKTTAIEIVDEGGEK